jgi:ABC-type bacteriocin/lantibiotic exporter with double-glycine peptidase domain
MTGRDIPYERQQDRRGCGAAALCMVYRSLGVACVQAEVWRRLARPGPWGALRTNTWRLAADALRCGLAALVLQTREPWAVLSTSAARDVRVILNHRLRSGSAEGHYSVLVAVDDEAALLHDPEAGPARHLRRAELLELWRPERGCGEVAGYVLVAVSNRTPDPSACAACGLILPEAIPCPACREPVPLLPGPVAGCLTAACPGRTWDRIFCPGCDCGLV